MKILFFSGKTENETVISQAITHHTDAPNVEIFHDLSRLEHRLRKRTHDITVAVFSIANREQMTHLLKFQDIIMDMRIMLILPENTPDIVSDALSLFPRYIEYDGSDFQTLGHMLGRYSRQAKKPLQRDAVRGGGSKNEV